MKVEYNGLHNQHQLVWHNQATNLKVVEVWRASTCKIQNKLLKEQPRSWAIDIFQNSRLKDILSVVGSCDDSLFC